MIEKHPATCKLYLCKNDHLKWDGRWYRVPKSMNGTAKELAPHCIFVPDYIPRQTSTTGFLFYALCCLALAFLFLYLFGAL